jgi:hypothetical protein
MKSVPEDTKMIDSTGYVLRQEEVQIEKELHRKGGVSFLCSHCRGFLGTSDYREFARRRSHVKELSPEEFEQALGVQSRKKWSRSDYLIAIIMLMVIALIVHMLQILFGILSW